MRVTPSQMRGAVQMAIRRVEPNPPKLRPSEAEMLTNHLGAVDALLGAVDADPEWLSELRERAARRRGGAR